MTLTLLGVKVEGVQDIEDPKKTHWIIKIGPYEVHITEKKVDGRKPVYYCSVKVGSEYILDSQIGTTKLEDVLTGMDAALRKYIREKSRVEFIYSVL